MPIKGYLLLAVTLLALGGCSYFQFPGVHRVEVQQGNIVTREMVDQLRPGMTKAQVRYVMGTPMIADSFNQDRWDYFYSRKVGNDVKELENVTIYFRNGELAEVSSDLDTEEAPSDG